MIEYTGNFAGQTTARTTSDDGDGDSDNFTAVVNGGATFEIDVSNGNVSGTASVNEVTSASDGDAGDPDFVDGTTQTNIQVTGTTNNIQATYNDGTVKIVFSGALSADQSHIVGTAHVTVSDPRINVTPVDIPIDFAIPTAVNGQTVGSGQTVFVSAGQSADGITVQSGGTLVVNGTATNVLTINGAEVRTGLAGAATIVFDGEGSIVQLGSDSCFNAQITHGVQTVWSRLIDGVLHRGFVFHQNIAVAVRGDPISGNGAPASANVTPPPNAIQILSGGIAIQTTLGSGGVQEIFDNGAAIDTIITNSGLQEVFSGTASGTLVNSGGYELVDGTAVGTVIAGGTMELATNASAGSAAISFVGSGGTLQLDSTTMPTNIIRHFVPTNTIDLAGVRFDGSGTVTRQANNVLEIVDNGATYHLNLDPHAGYVGFFHLSPDNVTGGTDVTVGGLVFTPIVSDDFTGAGISDVLWRNSGGEVDTWLMTNGQMTDSTVAGMLSSAWQFAGTGDITGTGVSDVVWQNTSTGAVESWLISNGNLSGGSGIGHASSVWQPLGTGDFNADGTSDLLWRNINTGEVDTWLLNNGQLSGGSALSSVSSAWQFAGIGDFTGHGTSDVLWHNTATGEVDTWLINNGHISGGAAIGFASSAWQCLGTGDFNNDGTGDILWRNTTTGEVDTWIMNNGQVTGGAVLGSVSSAWQFAGVGDFTGTGTSDILWRNVNTGEVDTWLITNDHLTGGTAISTASTAWQPQVIHTG